MYDRRVNCLKYENPVKDEGCQEISIVTGYGCIINSSAVAYFNLDWLPTGAKLINICNINLETNSMYKTL